MRSINDSKQELFDDGSPENDWIYAAIASALEGVCANSDKVINPISVFSGATPPAILFPNYQARIRRYDPFNISAVHVIAVIYMDRMQRYTSIFRVNSLTIHRAYLACVLVAAKFFNDQHKANSVYAQIGGIDRKEMNRLEIEVLNGLGWHLDVDIGEFNTYIQSLWNFLHQSNVSNDSLSAAPAAIPSPPRSANSDTAAEEKTPPLSLAPLSPGVSDPVELTAVPAADVIIDISKFFRDTPPPLPQGKKPSSPLFSLPPWLPGASASTESAAAASSSGHQPTGNASLTTVLADQPANSSPGFWVSPKRDALGGLTDVLATDDPDFDASAFFHGTPPPQFLQQNLKPSPPFFFSGGLGSFSAEGKTGQTSKTEKYRNQTVLLPRDAQPSKRCKK